MMEDVLVPLIVFGTIFGILYMYFTTRNKERLALIEKGADAQIFFSAKKGNGVPFWKVFVLNFSFLCIGIGLGVFLANLFVNNLNMDDEVAYPASIFLFAGLGLLSSFLLSKKLLSDKE
ncbi:MAG: hypothetical protein CVT96_03170 [Bacteroidetes bacterium HGW-Bacteroidetes-13]|nr:MAG: hypothetical protein CVT96_03170 [Bacteroidetes bacterium HGW-Bacteroidetes-13]